MRSTAKPSGVQVRVYSIVGYCVAGVASPTSDDATQKLTLPYRANSSGGTRDNSPERESGRCPILASTSIAVGTQWSGVAGANVFAGADSIAGTGKLSLVHAAHYTLNPYQVENRCHKG